MLTSLHDLVRLPLRMVPKSAVVPILTGPNRGFRWVVGSSTHGCWLGRYERQEQALLRRLVKPGMTVLDVGANVGFYTLLLSRLVGPSGQVVAFEPFPQSASTLKRHLRLNGVTNVIIEESALSETTGISTLYVGDASAASIVPKDHGLAPCHVRTRALDNWPFERIDFIKMDIEGAEGLAVLGMRKSLAKHHPTLYIALHGGPKEDAMRECLVTLGYHLTAVGGDLLARHPLVEAEEEKK